MKKRILFDLKQQYYFNSFISILQAFAGDDRFEISFYVGANDERTWGFVPVSRKARIERWLKTQGYAVARSPLGFDAVVAGDALKDPDRYGNPLLFVSDHGPGTKTLRFRNIVRQKDRQYTVFVEGRYWMEVIKRFGCEKDADWIMSGVPKLDTLFWPGYYDRARVLSGLGLSPDKKTVLYAPSYRPSCIPFIGDSVGALADDYNLIIKLHPYSWGGKYAPSRQSSQYVNLARRNPRIALIPRDDFDIHPYIFAADTVISDTSSALAICLALGKTGMVADFPYPRMKHSDGMPVVSDEPSEYLKGVFVHFSDAGRLKEAAEEALHPSEEARKRLLDYRDYYFRGLDGKAGLRARNLIVARLLGS